MQQVVLAVPDVLLCIGGTGPIGSALRCQVKQAGLENHIRFLGFVPEADLPLAYRAADFNLVTSVALEGFGLVAAEALAAGTPSLVTPVGGLAEVVAPLSDVLVFRSIAVSDIAEGIVAVVRGTVCVPSENACRIYAFDNFSVSKAVWRTAEVYREYLNALT
jgi:glycosyltransferase involved in cell wall biosynthesis